MIPEETGSIRRVVALMTASVWMKVIGCVMVIAGASGIGINMARVYEKRLEGLMQLRQMIYLLKAQILYANAPLEEAFKTVGERTAGALSELFEQVAKRIESQEGEAFFTIWKEEVELADLVLAQSDRQALSALGEHLGFLDRDMQERNLLLYLEQLDLEIQNLREHKQERCRLYTSLGIMGGLFLAILLC